MTTKPITPEQAIESKSFPDKVVETWNALIVESLSNGQATIKQEDIVRQLTSVMEVNRQVVFDKGWLNVEDFYRRAGWLVKYDKPGYNESYRAFFEFTSR